MACRKQFTDWMGGGWTPMGGYGATGSPAKVTQAINTYGGTDESSAAVFACGVIALPFVTAHAAVRADLPPEAVLTFGGLTLLATGRVVWCSVPDREADAAAGQRTTSVRHGAVRALALTCLLLCAGVFALSWGLWWYGGPVAALVGAGGHVVFTGTVVALLRRVRVRRPTSSTRLRTTVMPVVLAADVLLVGVGLATG